MGAGAGHVCRWGLRALVAMPRASPQQFRMLSAQGPPSMASCQPCSAATRRGCKGQSAKGRSRSATTSSDGPLLPAANSCVRSEPAGGTGPGYPLVAMAAHTWSVTPAVWGGRNS